MSSLLQSRWAQVQPQEQQPAKTNTQTNSSPQTISQQTSEHKPIPASTLSAAATEFSPLPAPPPNISTYDEFAQTGANQDDLFDDVVPESMQTRPQDDLFDDDFIPVAQPVEEPVPAEVAALPQPQPAQQTRTEPRSRGRGRGRGGITRDEQRRVENAESIPQSQPPENAPTGPKKEVQPSVRGDRHATGGVKKPKLTEAELAEKMAQISIKNASLAAAHARAEADAASFEQREAQAKIDASKRNEAAKARAKEERKDRQQMIGEREKNRQRKLKAMEGREWDAEKNEDDFSRGGRYDKKGSFAGDQADYTDGREYLLRDAGPNASRGGRRPEKAIRQEAPRREDFPELPSAAGKAESRELGKSSWADQVESSNTSA